MSPRTRLFVTALLLAAGLVAHAGRADDKVPEGKRVNLQGQLPLSKALAELKQQTGIEVKDKSDAGDPKIKLDLKDVTFWEALEAIAKEADVRIVPYFNEDEVALAPGAYKALPISYSGPFRTVVKRLSAVRDLETDAHFYVVSLEVAWEPGVKPFFMDMPPKGLKVLDDKMREIKYEDEGAGRQPVQGRTAEINLRLAGVPRTTNKIATLGGTVTLIGPTKWLTFTFDNLANAKADPKAATSTQEGVTTKLSKLEFKSDIWVVEVSLEYPKDGPKLESFEVGDFVAYNTCLLKNKDGKTVPDAGSETSGGMGTKAAVTYLFSLLDHKAVFGPKPDPGQWGLVYKTPGPLKEIPVKFEFKDLLLP